MKILHLDSGREMRGGQWQALRLHQALLAAGHESLLLAREGGPLLREAMERGLAAEPLKPARIRQLSRGFDLVHAHDARSHTLAALLSKGPFVVSRRVAFPVKTSALSRWKYRRASRYLAVSKYVAGTLLQAGVDVSRIDVVYDGVEVPAAAAEGSALLTPYTLDAAKGMVLAEHAAKEAGIELKLSENLERDLPGARAMVYLTEVEGLGSGILLAMAYGVAVVASRRGGIPELIEDGVTGILVPNDIGAIAQVLRSLTWARCREMGRKARETVRQRFTVEMMTAATLYSYRKALDA
ncbi:MAG TPA: glycosyltransferase family 4 protein [Bryobacteraceae bacterium]|nr:glycosyltransferase family 4 protein [Bryobacteraceae bacterium]